ncbi:hypothetical protein [Microbacterium yannicii]|uniref:hypothetical protein n=1 Tax=Microbacterium yannicii TaxID=671622 RepID=UPI0003797960|nr:hypothetical protein [Microbacterium yannicii]
MADFARFLPLSNRPHGDESGVTSDRHAAEAGVVEQAAKLIARSGADEAEPLTRGFLREAGLEGLSPTDVADPAARLAATALAVRTGKRRGIRHLSRTVRALLLLGRKTATAIALDPTISGSVALYGATSASFDRRAVLVGHTVRATDAEWAFGRGPVLEGTAMEIVAFVLGISDRAPRLAAVD